MNTNYLIIIIFLLIIFNKNNIEKFTVERCRNGMKENGEKCDCDEFNKRCPTKEEAFAFILKKNKAGKNGKNLLADHTPPDEKGCKQCWINMGDKGPHCQKRVIDCGDTSLSNPECEESCNTKFKNKQNAIRCCIARECKYPGNDYHSKQKKEEACTVNFVRNKSGETVASTEIDKSNKVIVDCNNKCSNDPNKKCCLAKCRFPGNNPSNVEFRKINCEKQEAVVRKESLARAKILSQLPAKNKLSVSLDETLEKICSQVLKK